MAGSVTYLQTPSSTADASTYTFSSQSLGTAASSRVIIVAVLSRAASTPIPTVNSVTVAGISATQVVSRNQVSGTGANNNIVAIWQAAVPTGTTGDVVVTLSRTMARCAAIMWRAVDIDVASPNTASAAVTDPTTTISDNVTTIADGIVVAASAAAAGTTATWSGVTEDVDTTVESFMTVTGASDEFASSGSQSVSATFGSTGSGTSGGASLAIAAFGPAAPPSSSIIPLIHHHRQLMAA